MEDFKTNSFNFGISEILNIPSDLKGNLLGFLLEVKKAIFFSIFIEYIPKKMPDQGVKASRPLFLVEHFETII